jgi:hypothetical protein
MFRLTTVNPRSHLPLSVYVAPRMHLPASEARMVTHGGAQAAIADGGRWVLLQHMRHLIYFCNIQMKHLQHTSETTEALATYVYNSCKNTRENLKTRV